MKNPDLIVIGAGAAGLMCAITAAKRGRRVLVLERSNKIGKKILMSGGGRCNFTNLHVTPERFISGNPHFCKSALSRYTQWDFIELVEQHGIEYFEKETVNGLSGQLFCKQSSKLIVKMLLDECREAGVSIRLDCETDALFHENAWWMPEGRRGSSKQAGAPASGFQLKTNQGNFAAESLVVASGALSIPSLGGSGIAYQLADRFGLHRTATRAGLVPFTFTGQVHEVCKRLAGVSTEVSLFNERQSFREDILFTHRGLSGPAALQLSSYWLPGEAISMDLLPGENASAMLKGLKQSQPKHLLRTCLDRWLPRKLALELEQQRWADLSETALAEWPGARLEAIGRFLNAWSLKPAGTEGYRTAEVTLGGIDTHGLSSRTMASSTPGLYFIGEAVDVTGHLGGFNFQWAWSSGYAAGQAV
ncbi:MAG: NAD(P)/FAD-dependent oxidoreductase [Xanthomonadales bacterium]|nr:NAD(P)/FAD-dependent oxidoreductase [Xanthomonadales bacterium]